MIKTTQEPKTARAREVAKRLFRHEDATRTGVLIVIIAVLAVITKGASIGRGNIVNILLRASNTGIAAIGQFLVILTAGIDISIGGTAVFCMCFGAVLMTGTESAVAPFLAQITLPMVAAIMIMLLLGLGVGVINGLFISRLRIPPLILTIAMWQITLGGAFAVTTGNRVRGLPDALAFFGQGRVAGAPVPFIIFLVLVAIVYFILYHTAYGRSVYSVGGNPVSAWLSGVNIEKIRFSVYAISGFLAALAGFVAMARTMIAGVDSIPTLMLDTVAAVCVGGTSLFGGKGSLIGAIVGLAILSVVSNGMNVIGLGTISQNAVRGIIIVTAVAIDVTRKR